MLPQCTEFVNKYGPEVVKLLLDAASPTAVCTLLTLCLGDEGKCLPGGACTVRVGEILINPPQLAGGEL